MFYNLAAEEIQARSKKYKWKFVTAVLPGADLDEEQTLLVEA
jgi:hypothetical protein